MDELRTIAWGGNYLPSREVVLPPVGEGVFRVACLDAAIGTARRHGKAYPTCLPDSAWASLACSGLGAVSLASNHSLDAGEVALHRMAERLCGEGGYPEYYGLKAKPFVSRLVGGVRCAIVGCLERCWSRGRLLFPEEQVERLIHDLRPDFGRVIVTPHWGREGEFSNHPSPAQRMLARRWVEAGADAVIGHHPHMIHGRERVWGKPVYYSLGNLHFEHAQSEGRPLATVGLVVQYAPAAGQDRWSHYFTHFGSTGIHALPQDLNAEFGAFMDEISGDLNDCTRPWNHERWERTIARDLVTESETSWARVCRSGFPAPLRRWAWSITPSTRRRVRLAGQHDSPLARRRAQLCAQLDAPPVPRDGVASTTPVSSAPSPCIITRVPHYDRALLRPAIDSIIDSVPGLGEWMGEADPNRLVVVKPNWILQGRVDRPEEWEAVITHPEVVLATVEVLAARMKGRGTLCLCDAPQTNADFEAIVARGNLRTGLADVQKAHPDMGIEILDLRREVWTMKDGVIEETRQGGRDPRGYVRVDLGAESLFAGVDGRRRFYGASPDIGEVNRHHRGALQEYLIAGTAMKCDLLVSLPKMKTHRKTGMTCCLKNLVGINGDKNWLPHHAMGSPASGGDKFPDVRPFWWLESTVRESCRRLMQGLPLPGRRVYSSARRVGVSMFGDSSRTIRNGNWEGNDTCWRMVLDLNRALLYADGQGVFQSGCVRRRFLAIVDAVVAGEGDGPMLPDPVPCGLLLGGADPAAVDAVACKLMGFDPRCVPAVREAFAPHRFPVAMTPLREILVQDERQNGTVPLRKVSAAIGRCFVPHVGWPHVMGEG